MNFYRWNLSVPAAPLSARYCGVPTTGFRAIITGLCTFGVLLCALTASATAAPGEKFVTYPGGKGPGQGKHLVFLSGDEEYRSEEGLPMLARMLSRHHGFQCTVLFAVGADGTIDPNNRESLPGAEFIDKADALIILLRFRAYPEPIMKRFIAAYQSGKPIIALRTSTHAFQFPKDSPFASYNNFGKNVLGEGWVSHWGRHKSEATLGVVEPKNAEHPIVKNLGDLQIFGDTDVYEAYPPKDADILVRGQVLKGMKANSGPANYAKKRATDGKEQPVNDPMMAVAWSRTYKNENGKTNRIFTTTMGAATDLQSEGLRALIVNAIYWGLGLDVPTKVDVPYVGDYRPSKYGFNGFRKGVKPESFDVKPGSGVDLSIKGDDLLKPKPRAARPPLAPSALPLQYIDGERIAFVGGSTGERMSLYGHFETLLQARNVAKNLVIRNFSRPADTVTDRQRPGNYTALDDPLFAFSADTFFCFFGYNESFAGPEGVAQFKADYIKFLNEFQKRYTRDDTGAPPRVVLVSPIAFEPTNDKFLPDGAKENANLKLYTAAIADVAKTQNVAFVDLFTPTYKAFTAEPGMQFTINGAHVNEAGDRESGVALDQALSAGEPNPLALGTSQFERVRKAVVDKAWVHQQDYRMLDGWYVYGGRRTWDTETFPREYLKIRNMAAVRDVYIRDLINGKSVPPVPDDSNTGALYLPPTRFGDPRQAYSEPKQLRYLTPEEDVATMTVPDGFKVVPFADESKFPELIKPVQIAFDNKGRLWVSCMPSYPLWKPGDPKPQDKLLIFEDTNNDGQADVCKTFYDQLHCPTGFEFFNGGVLVVDQPRMIWIKDTDGDDKADLVVPLNDGWGTDDTHHTIGAFEYSHGGLLHMLEGVAMSTTVETPRGAFRHGGSPGSYVLDPRTQKIRHFMTPGYGNPWCYVFDSWGQGIVGDGTGAQQHWDAPLSGEQIGIRRGMNPIFNNQGMRPAVGSEFLNTRQFPDDVQGQFIYACVINMNGIPRFIIRDEKAGFNGERTADLLKSTDKNFRPVDPQIGPDGALWFGDWCNALIGHMQYSQRDPNRDKEHGRLYRLVYTKKPLLTPVTQFGKTPTELLDQLKIYEPRTRYNARRELRDRPTSEVLAAISAWAAKLDPEKPETAQYLCEALWVQQGHHAVQNDLLQRVLKCENPKARAAAIHVVSDEYDRIPNALAIVKNAVQDDHPRVRLEAIRALSFFPTLAAAEAALSVTQKPMDYWLDYTLMHTIAALESSWRKAYDSGTLVLKDESARKYLIDHDKLTRPDRLAGQFLSVLLSPETSSARRKPAYDGLLQMRGNVKNGQAIFARTCMSCHRVGKEGVVFGPELSDVASRLSRYDIVESVIEPNAKLDAKFLTTVIVTDEGVVLSGFVAKETDDAVTLSLPEGKTQVVPKSKIEERGTAKQSSMPENLGASIAPTEFLDLIEYLGTLKAGAPK